MGKWCQFILYGSQKNTVIMSLILRLSPCPFSPWMFYIIACVLWLVCVPSYLRLPITMISPCPFSPWNFIFLCASCDLCASGIGIVLITQLNPCPFKPLDILYSCVRHVTCVRSIQSGWSWLHYSTLVRSALEYFISSWASFDLCAFSTNRGSRATVINKLAFPEWRSLGELLPVFFYVLQLL